MGRPFYPTWRGMMQRCYNPEDCSFKSYGARGIRVCDKWKDFYEFEKWAESTIGKKTKEYTIDRIDNNGDYCPENCRWATPKEQGRNKRDTIMITINNETKPLVEWCEIYGFKFSTVRERLKRGWSIEETFNCETRSLIHQPDKRICDKYYSINGIEKNISDWAKEYNISRHTVYNRLKRGWDIETALKTKPDKQNRISKIQSELDTNSTKE